MTRRPGGSSTSSCCSRPYKTAWIGPLQPRGSTWRRPRERGAGQSRAAGPLLAQMTKTKNRVGWLFAAGFALTAPLAYLTPLGLAPLVGVVGLGCLAFDRPS